MVVIAIAAFIGIYLFKIPFPIIILAAGLVGWLGQRYAPATFAGGGHGGKVGAPEFKGVVDLMFERGRARPRHPVGCQGHQDLRDLAADLARAGAGALAPDGRRERLDADRRLLQHDGGRHLRWRLCGSCLCRAGRGRDFRVASGGRDGGRARPGRDHAGTADPRPPVRRLSSPPTARQAVSIRCWRGASARS